MARPKFTPVECKAVLDGFNSILHLAHSTNMGTDARQLAAALKDEKQEQKDFDTGHVDLLAAKAFICRFWYKGTFDPCQPLDELIDLRLGRLLAVQLGARQQIERALSSHAGPLLRNAHYKALEASDALKARQDRWLAGQ